MENSLGMSESVISKESNETELRSLNVIDIVKRKEKTRATMIDTNKAVRNKRKETTQKLELKKINSDNSRRSGEYLTPSKLKASVTISNKKDPEPKSAHLSSSKYGDFFKMKFHFTGIVYTGILILRFQKNFREKKLIAMTNQLLDKTSKKINNFKDEEFTLLNIKKIQEELIKKREYDDPYSLELEEKITWSTINKRALILEDNGPFFIISKRFFLYSK